MRKMYIFKHNHNPYAPPASPIPLPLGGLHFIVTNPSLKKSWIRPWAVSEIHLKIPCGCMFITFYSVATSRSSFPDPVGALTLFSILSDGSADICFWQGQGSGQGYTRHWFDNDVGILLTLRSGSNFVSFRRASIHGGSPRTNFSASALFVYYQSLTW